MTKVALKLRPLQRFGPVAAAAICVCIAHAAVAEETRIYEWREANGVVSYAQRPPLAGTSGVPSRVIKVHSLTPARQAAVRASRAADNAAGRAAAKRFREQVEAVDRKIDVALQ